jgi:hypothetical protein
MDSVIALPEGVTGQPVFSDGFGARFLGFDADSGDPIEILAFHPQVVGVEGFGSAVGVRVARVAGARHTLFARARRIERPTPDSLLLVSDRVAGWRLADVLDIANRVRLTLDTTAVLNLLRQLVPAVAMFGRHQRDLTIGTIAPERLLLTPQGRLVVSEYVLGDAIQKLALSRDDLWRGFRVPVVAGDTSRDALRSDVLAIGVVALSLLLGRRLREDEFPFALGDLVKRVTETHGTDLRPLSPALASWLGRALQLEGHKPLQSPKEAQVAFEELLATERGYVTSPAQLEAFTAQFEQRVGPPPEPERVAVRAAQPTSPEPVHVAAAAAVIEAPATTPNVEPAPATLAAVADAPPTPAEVSTVATAEPDLVPSTVPDAVAITQAEPDHLSPSETDSSEASVAPPPFVAAELANDVIAPATADEGKAEVEVVGGRVADEPRGWWTRLVAGLALLAVLEAAAILWLWNRSAEALLRDGELAVQSRPTGARVSLDDDDLGVTPLSVRLAPGTYTLKVQQGNAEPRVIVVQIRAGVQTAQYLELQTAR